MQQLWQMKNMEALRREASGMSRTGAYYGYVMSYTEQEHG